jgi:hypothetical protein
MSTVGDPLGPVSRRVASLFGLDAPMADAITREVIDALSESVDGYVIHRHAELRRAGLANEAIFEAIRSEIAELRFRAPDLSERQIRRRIYG